MDTDRNLLFGVLALQADLLDPPRFAEACTAWSARKATPLADLLVERGWLTPSDRADVEKLLQRKLKKHGGDARAGLAEMTTNEVRHSLAGVADAEVCQSLASPTAPPAGHVLLSTTAYVPEARDRYTLSRLHATGGIGRVWLARDDSLGRDVALKELRPERVGQPGVWARFLKEAQITGQLEHPGIVPIYEVGRRPDDQAPFYTMRFVRGRTLAEAARAYHDRRRRGAAGPLDLRELLTAFVGVCNAVAYAHSRGVIHRDLKPSNVVLGDYGEVILLDWGLARLLDQADAAADAPPVDVPRDADGEGTLAGQVLGTPAYMAPEQAEGRLDRLGPATDVYGLGAILYEVLTGRPPFHGPETTAVLRQVVHETPPRPREVTPAAPAALEAVCLKALAKQPAGRYGSAKDLAGEVQHWLAGEPVAAHREPWAARAGRWVRRHRVLVTGAAAAGLVALAGLAVVLGVQARANRDLRAANERERERFDLAVEAIKKFHTGVSEDVLLKEDRFKDLRNRLLRDAVDFYRKLESLLSAQADERSRRELGRAYQEVGELTDKIGSAEEALAAHRAALEVRRGLARGASPDAAAVADVGRSLVAVGILLDKTGRADEAIASFEEARSLLGGTAASGAERDVIRGVLAHSYYWTGAWLRRRGKTAEALAAFEQARAIENELTEARPDVVDYQRILSWAYNDVGNLLKDTGKPAEALAAYEKSGRIKQKIADDHPDVAEYRRDLAISHSNVGNVLDQTGRPAEALAAYERARALWRAVADAHPAVTQFQSDLAGAHTRIGWLLSQTGRPAEALAEFEKARVIRQALAEANPTVAQFQGDLANSHLNAGNVLGQTGQPAEALAAFDKARAIWQVLAEANPTVTDFQSALAASHYSIGWMVSQTGKPAEALAEFEKARMIRQALADANPAVAQYRSDLAASHYSIGWILSHTGKPAEALAAYERARAISASLTTTNPAVTGFQSGLADTDVVLGNLLRLVGRTPEAVAAYERARAVYESLAKANPDAPQFRHGVGITQNNLGEVFRVTGHPAEAMAAFEQALAINEALVRANPTVTRFRRSVAFNLTNIGRLLLQAGKPAEARAAFEKARAVRQALADANPSVTTYRSELADSLARVGVLRQREGQPSEAVALFRQAVAILERLPTLTPDDHYGLACYHALLAGVSAAAGSGLSAVEGRAEADQAMDVLRRAVAVGYRDVAELRTDTDLDALRPREDFQRLVQELQSPGKSGGP
jgi:serine/threonine-protein kinase